MSEVAELRDAQRQLRGRLSRIEDILRRDEPVWQPLHEACEDLVREAQDYRQCEEAAFSPHACEFHRRTAYILAEHHYTEPRLFLEMHRLLCDQPEGRAAFVLFELKRIIGRLRTHLDEEERLARALEAAGNRRSRHNGGA